MTSALRSVFSLLLGSLFLMLGNGMLSTLLGIRVVQIGASEIQVGLLMSAYFLGLIVATRYFGRLLSRIGHIRAFTVFASVYSAAVLGHGLSDSIPYWLLLRAIEGSCMGGFFMCTESWLNARASNAQRGAVLSLYMCAVYLGQGSGQFLLNLAPPQAFELLAFVSIMMSMSLIPVALTKIPEPPKPSPQPFAMKRLIEISPLGVFGCVASGLLLGGFLGVAPAFTASVGLDVSQTSLFVAVSILGGLILQWPLGILSDRIDRRYVIAFAMFIAALASAAMLTLSARYWPLIIVTGILGGMINALYALAISHANDFISTDDVVGASGGLLLAYSLAAVAGPFLGGALMTVLGASGFPLYLLIVSVAGLAFTLYRILVGKSASEEERGEYQMMPNTSVLVAEILSEDVEEDGAQTSDHV